MKMQAGDSLEALIGLLSSLSVSPAERHLETITAIGISSNLFWKPRHTFVLAGAPAVKGLKSVRIQFDPHEIMYARSDRTDSDMEWLLKEFRHKGGYMCERCRCRHKIHHFAEILQQATDLEELNISTVRDHWECLLPLPFIVANTYWRKLRKISLGAFTATEAELRDFLLRHQDSLEVLQLRNGSITQGTWSSLLNSIAGKLPKLRRVRFYGRLESREQFGESPKVEYDCSHCVRHCSPRSLELEAGLEEYLIEGEGDFTCSIRHIEPGESMKTWSSQHGNFDATDDQWGRVMDVRSHMHDCVGSNR